MATTIDVFNRADAYQRDLIQVFCLRKEVFVDRLAWNVRCIDGLEYDEFDDDLASYVVVRSEEALAASCRLISIVNPTMLSVVFPQLLRGESLPSSPGVVEISRLTSTRAKAGAGAFSMLLQGLRDFAEAKGVETYVFVTTTAIERLLQRYGLTVERFGDRCTTNIDGVVSVALRLQALSIPRLQ